LASGAVWVGRAFPRTRGVMRQGDSQIALGREGKRDNDGKGGALSGNRWKKKTISLTALTGRGRGWARVEADRGRSVKQTRDLPGILAAWDRRVLYAF